jgi:hypothetical protein
MRHPSLISLLCLTAVNSAAAQLPRLTAGSRIRVTRSVQQCAAATCAAGGERLVGWLVAARADSVFLATSPGSVAALSTSSITRIERARRDPWAPLEYTALGAASGAAFGAALWGARTVFIAPWTALDGNVPDHGSGSAGGYALKGAAVGAGLGLVMGLIAEGAAQTQWVNVFTAAPAKPGLFALSATAGWKSLGLVGRIGL